MQRPHAVLPIAYRHAVIKNDIWVEHAVGADLDVFTNNNPGFDPRAGADLRACSDRNMRSKKSSKGNISTRGNYRGGVYPGSRCRAGWSSLAI